MIRKLRITVAGKAYDVEVEVLDDAGHQGPPNPGQSAHIASAPVSSPVSSASPKPGAASTAGGVPSPLAGKVVSISVNVGDSVAQGDTVVVLEAMKMNTLVTAPVAGSVSEILVKPGDAVEEGQPLITIS
jgi:biotin carboxyl carrier protein